MDTRKHRVRTEQKTRKVKHKLRKSYGYIIVPKGLRLYHISHKRLCSLPEKPMIFFTLHPSEYYYPESFVNVFELLEDIELLFMISVIRRMRIFSSLSNLLDKPTSNLFKTDNKNLKCFLHYLFAENLKGWISSIENKGTIEFAIFNDPKILKLISCSPMKNDWINSKYNEEYKIIPKQWGSLYPICKNIKSIQFIINKRFEEDIQKYIEIMREEDPYGSCFLILIENSKILFFESPKQDIKWCT